MRERRSDEVPMTTSDRVGRTQSWMTTLLGEGNSKMKPWVDDALQGVVKTNHLRE